MAAGEASRSGLARRTSAVSRTTRGSIASRWATRVSPKTSNARVDAAGDSARTSSSDAFGRGTPMCVRNTSRITSTRSRANWRGSRPRSAARSTAVSSPVTSRRPMADANSVMSNASVTPPDAATESRADRASRAEPLPRLATAARVASSISNPAFSATSRSSPVRASIANRRNSNTCVRLRIVGRTFCGSVVASTNTTWAGGSSRVFSSVFDAAVDSI